MGSTARFGIDVGLASRRASHEAVERLKLLLGSMSAASDTQLWMPIVDRSRPPVMRFHPGANNQSTMLLFAS